MFLFTRKEMQNTEQKLLQKSSMLHLRQFVRSSPDKIGNDEWRDFCKWVEELPYSELITMEGLE